MSIEQIEQLNIKFVNGSSNSENFNFWCELSILGTYIIYNLKYPKTFNFWCEHSALNSFLFITSLCRESIASFDGREQNLPYLLME